MNSGIKKPTPLSEAAPEVSGSPQPLSLEARLAGVLAEDETSPLSSADTSLSWKSLLGVDEPPPRQPSTKARKAQSHARTARTPRSAAGVYSARPAPEHVGNTSLRPKANRSGVADVTIPPAPPPLDLESLTDARASVASRANPLKSRIEFPSHLRDLAKSWLKTGSLSLPNCSSPRHARAVQRVLLLALLAEPGYSALPLGLKQRVGWLFSPGWESVSQGESLGELGDLVTVLGLPAAREVQLEVLEAAQFLIPNPLPSVRPPSSYPPARR